MLQVCSSPPGGTDECSGERFGKTQYRRKQSCFYTKFYPSEHTVSKCSNIPHFAGVLIHNFQWKKLIFSLSIPVRKIVIMRPTVEKSIKDQIIMFPIPLTIYHIVMLICTAASLGISNKNEHYVIALSYSFQTVQTPNTFHFKDHKTALFQQITIQQSALNKIAL